MAFTDCGNTLRVIAARLGAIIDALAQPPSVAPADARERLQRMLDTYPNLYLDTSATRWMVREISAQRDPAREFVIRNADRLLFGTDQVSGDDRGFDFLASRFWCHRKLWETAFTGPSPIYDPDLPKENQPPLRGLALPDEVLQKLYHDNAVKLLERVGIRIV